MVYPFHASLHYCGYLILRFPTLAGICHPGLFSYKFAIRIKLLRNICKSEQTNRKAIIA